jgi:hypothetical protein
VVSFECMGAIVPHFVEKQLRYTLTHFFERVNTQIDKVTHSAQRLQLDDLKDTGIICIFQPLINEIPFLCSHLPFILTA